MITIMLIRFGIYFRLLRPTQWVKNLFVLAPIFFSGSAFSESSLVVLGAALVFSFLCGGVYVFNDWQDRAEDRLHRVKRLRPIASNLVTGREAIAIVIFVFLLVLLLIRLFNIPAHSLPYLGAFLVLNVAYSLGLKHVPILELLILSSGFVIRILFGAAVVSLAVSPWMLFCTGLFSLMIAASKRSGEMANAPSAYRTRNVLSGYTKEFLNQTCVIFTAATITAYLFFCTTFVLNNRFGLEILLTVPFVFYGILEYTRAVDANDKDEDPTSLVLGSKRILTALICWVSTFMIILYS